MAKRIVSRRELLDRWRGIEEEDYRNSNPSKDHDILQMKNAWFSDAFSFLIALRKETHIWCGCWDLMGPLLETFYNSFKDSHNDSPLKLLWQRISHELRHCTQCICQHHQAQEAYNADYEPDTVAPLLSMLQGMDEERVTEHLKEINARITKGEHDPEIQNTEVVSILFEVLSFPTLLDDQSLVCEFQIFIDVIDSSHELTLAGNQQYPGVYALLFLKSGRVRSIGFRLAASMGKLRRAADLEPLQPLLKKCISFLETEALPSTFESSRQRVQLERLTVWLGIKSLLGFLEPLAFEEGLLERYPIFLSIVLNHVSDDTLEFTYAINCLRLIFEMLGCKLWLRTTFSPSVMRNTLLGQCFHTRNEKSHKEIFDIFQPFLQSLEALQDGEHEKQRRHFLYFLLHQVTQSSNFSFLMRKKACKIALLIVHRGYTMDPPCPPFECAHMWGPSLVCSLKDSSLHSSLRQPAFDLMHTVIVSDASALVSFKMKYHVPLSIVRNLSADFNDDEDELPLSHDAEEKESSCWSEFSAQSKRTSQECKEWMCIPMLWFDILVGLDPSALPISFSKAVFWALSRFSMVEPETSVEMVLSVRDCVSSYAEKISASFGWETPNGSDDGGDGKESRNSVKASILCIPLIRTFKRCAAHFVAQMEQGDLRKQWTWEPMMSESLILLLVDPKDNVRHIARIILEHVSNTRGLSSGLQFLCSSAASLSAIYLGLRYAMKMVLVDSVLSNFHNLHHLFFVVCKLLKEVVSSSQKLCNNSVNDSKGSKFLYEGGFLHQPAFDSSPISTPGCLSNVVDVKSWDRFCCLLSGSMWPTILKCLVEGKVFIDNKNSQMTCVRLLELLPVIFEWLSSSAFKLFGSSEILPSIYDFKWLHDLVVWGKSSLLVVSRHWKQCVQSLLNLVKGSCHESAFTVGAIERLIFCDTVPMDDLKNKISCLAVSFSIKTAHRVEKKMSKSKASIFGHVPSERRFAVTEPSSHEKEKVHVLDRVVLPENRTEDKVIVLSDDETENSVEPDVVILSCSRSRQDELDDKMSAPIANKCTLPDAVQKKAMHSSSSKNLLDSFQSNKVAGNSIFPSQKQETDASKNKSSSKISSCVGQMPASFVDAKGSDGIPKTGANIDKKAIIKEPSHDAEDDPWERALKSARHQKLLPTKISATVPKHEVMDKKKQDRNLSDANDTFPPRNSADSAPENLIGETVTSNGLDQACSVVGSSADKDLERRDTILKELVCCVENDPWERALKFAGRPQSLKQGVSVPKRQAIQLTVPIRNKSSNFQRLDASVRRFKPPRLDDWYRPILEIDYFSTVGLSSPNEDENETLNNFKEVPLCFISADQYVEIFRPLILEEFKAKLQNSYAEASSTEMCCGSLCILSVERIDDFHLIRGILDESESASSRGCSENDLVLLTKVPLQNSTHNVHVLGKVERREKDSKSRSNILVIRFYLQNGSSRSNKARRFLVERSKWYISRIMSITPQLREFQALSSIKDIPMLPIIMNPVDQSLKYAESKKVDLGKLSLPMQQALKSSFNDCQLQAISAAIGDYDMRKVFELSLIQGPPGTGKTRTIVAIVSALLALGTMKNHDALKTFTGNSKFMSTANTKPRSQISQSTAIARAWQDAAFARQLAKEDEKNSGAIENSESVEINVRGRVLLCAQSNAAVDELVSRISTDGLYDKDGKMYKPYVVRVGNAKTVHPNSLPFFIDTLVEQRLAEEKMNGGDDKNDVNGDSPLALRSKLEKLVDNIQFYEAKRANLRDGNRDVKSCSEDEASKESGDQISDAAIEAKLKVLYQQKKVICISLAAAQSRERKASEEIKALKHKLRKAILREAEIVMTTLSGCGGDLYGVCCEPISSHRFGNSSEHSLFDAVVIDEAAQALEPATLIPLQLLKSHGTKCIMVGDPKQLPATVLSNIASKFLYECSMFERLQRAGHPVIMLTEQYRMHPEISRFPSLHFYDNKLVNGNQMGSKSAPFHESVYFGPYVFFDVVDGTEHHRKNSGALSLCNESEADAAVEVLRFFKRRYPAEFVGGRIGVITPYKSQVSLLRSRMNNAFGPNATCDMEFNTVDGFQGREVDILILSTVRASDQSAKATGINSSVIGFVADVRRMNVALTRAKLSLWIVGNARTLETNLNWAALIKNAKERDLVIALARPYESIFKKHSSSSRGNVSSTSLGSHSGHLKDGRKVEDTSKGIEEAEIKDKKSREGNSKRLDRRVEKHTGRHLSVCDSRTDRKHRESVDGNHPSRIPLEQDHIPSKDINPTATGKQEEDNSTKDVQKDEDIKQGFEDAKINAKKTHERNAKHLGRRVENHIGRSTSDDDSRSNKKHSSSTECHRPPGVSSWQDCRSPKDVSSTSTGRQDKNNDMVHAKKVKNASQGIEKAGANAGKTYEGNTRDLHMRLERRHRSDYHSRHDRKHRVSSGSDHSSSISLQQDCGSSEDVQLTMTGRCEVMGGGLVEELQGDLADVVNANKGKALRENLRNEGIDPDAEVEKDASVRISVSEASTRSLSSDHGISSNSSQRNQKPKSAENNIQRKEVNGDGQASIQADAPEDLIASKKRQRDAVEPLLSSAFITSKKPENLSKAAPAKRPLSPNVAAKDLIKPPKMSRAQPSLSTHQVQERTSGTVHSPNHQSQSTRNRSSRGWDLDEAWESFKDVVRDSK